MLLSGQFYDFTHFLLKIFTASFTCQFVHLEIKLINQHRVNTSTAIRAHSFLANFESHYRTKTVFYRDRDDRSQSKPSQTVRMATKMDSLTAGSRPANAQEMTYKPGDFVWALIRGHPKWPATVAVPEDFPNVPNTTGRDACLVQWFLAAKKSSQGLLVSWVRFNDIEPFRTTEVNSMVNRITKTRSGGTMDELKECVQICLAAISAKEREKDSTTEVAEKEEKVKVKSKNPPDQTRKSAVSASVPPKLTAIMEARNGLNRSESAEIEIAMPVQKISAVEAVPSVTAESQSTTSKPDSDTPVRPCLEFSADHGPGFKIDFDAVTDFRATEPDSDVSDSHSGSSGKSSILLFSSDSSRSSIQSDSAVSGDQGKPARKRGRPRLNAPVWLSPVREIVPDKSPSPRMKSPSKKRNLTPADGYLVLPSKRNKFPVFLPSAVVTTSTNVALVKPQNGALDVMASNPPQPAQHLVDLLSTHQSPLNDGSKSATNTRFFGLSELAEKCANSDTVAAMESRLAEALVVSRRRSDVVVIKAEYAFTFPDCDTPSADNKSLGANSVKSCTGRLIVSKVKLDENLYHDITLPDWLKMDTKLFIDPLTSHHDLAAKKVSEARISLKSVFPRDFSPFDRTLVTQCRNSVSLSFLPSFSLTIAGPQLQPASAEDEIVLPENTGILIPTGHSGLADPSLTVLYHIPWSTYSVLTFSQSNLALPVQCDVIQSRMAFMSHYEPSGERKTFCYGNLTLISQEGMEYGSDYALLRHHCSRIGEGVSMAGSETRRRLQMPYPAWLVEMLLVAVYDDVFVRFGDFSILIEMLKFAEECGIEKMWKITRMALLEELAGKRELFPEKLVWPGLLTDNLLRTALEVNFAAFYGRGEAIGQAWSERLRLGGKRAEE